MYKLKNKSALSETNQVMKTVMGIHLFQENGSLSISPEDLIQYYFCKTFFVRILRTSSEYLTIYGQGSVFKICFQVSVVKTDPCLYLFECSPDVLNKKTKVLDIFNMDKNVL